MNYWIYEREPATTAWQLLEECYSVKLRFPDPCFYLSAFAQSWNTVLKLVVTSKQLSTNWLCHQKAYDFCKQKDFKENAHLRRPFEVVVVLFLHPAPLILPSSPVLCGCPTVLEQEGQSLRRDQQSGGLGREYSWRPPKKAVYLPVHRGAGVFSCLGRLRKIIALRRSSNFCKECFRHMIFEPQGKWGRIFSCKQTALQQITKRSVAFASAFRGFWETATEKSLCLFVLDYYSLS